MRGAAIAVSLLEPTVHLGTAGSLALARFGNEVAGQQEQQARADSGVNSQQRPEPSRCAPGPARASFPLQDAPSSRRVFRRAAGDQRSWAGHGSGLRACK